MPRIQDLKNMKMPNQPMAEDELDNDLEAEMGEETEPGELEAEPEMGGGLEEITDDELVQEAIMRGILPDDFELPLASIDEVEAEADTLEDEDELEDL